MRIIADTATLFAPADGEANGMTVIPVCVNIGGKTYKDYTEISPEQFLDMVAEGAVPTSSQPAVGDYLDIFENSDEELIVLTVGDGLSGGYQTALGARCCAAASDRIHVINSKTLAGPLRFLAKKAVRLRDQGLGIESIKTALSESIESSISFVIPEDFEFLKRSGRLTAITAKLGGVLKLLPVLTQTEDMTRIRPISVRRTWQAAADVIIQRLRAHGVDSDYLISVCHAGAPERAKKVLEQIKAAFSAETELLPLSPALMTHGGPGCIVVQAIKK